MRVTVCSTFPFLSIIRNVSSFLSAEMMEKPGSGLQNTVPSRGFHFAGEGAGGVDDVINIASRLADMLEVVDMSADVHIYFMLAEYRVEAGLHIQAFAVVLRSFGVDGVVSGNDDPVFFCGGQYGVYPGKLLL